MNNEYSNESFYEEAHNQVDREQEDAQRDRDMEEEKEKHDEEELEAIKN